MAFGMKNSGFTIVEITAAMIIIALICSLGGIALYRHLETNTLNSAGQSLLHAARYARLLAVYRQCGCRMIIDFDKKKYWLDVPSLENIRDSAVYKGQSQTIKMISNPYKYPRQLPEKIRFSQIRLAEQSPLTTGQATILFYADGSAQSALIHLAAPNSFLSLLVYPHTARARLQRGETMELPGDVIDLDARGLQSQTVFLR